MARTLNSRIERLERTSRRPTGDHRTAGPTDEDFHRRLADLARRLNLLVYEPRDREALLTLEERLAIARIDAAPKPDRWVDTWDPQLARVRPQLVPRDDRPAIAARELEIRILERDGKIVQQIADDLRQNIRDYFHATPSSCSELVKLPCPVLIEDERVLASEALLKCPLRESLPLEEQLELANREAEDDQRRVDSNPVDDRFRAFRKRLHEITIRDLEHKIAERDRIAVDDHQ